MQSLQCDAELSFNGQLEFLILGLRIEFYSIRNPKRKSNRCTTNIEAFSSTIDTGRTASLRHVDCSQLHFLPLIPRFWKPFLLTAASYIFDSSCKKSSCSSHRLSHCTAQKIDIAPSLTRRNRTKPPGQHHHPLTVQRRQTSSATDNAPATAAAIAPPQGRCHWTRPALSLPLLRKSRSEKIGDEKSLVFFFKNLRTHWVKKMYFFFFFFLTSILALLTLRYCWFWRKPEIYG